MLSMGKSTISMAIFNSYVDITRGYPNLTDGAPGARQAFALQEGHEKKRGNNVLVLD